MEASPRGQKSVALGLDERVMPLDALRVKADDLGVSRESHKYLDQSIIEKSLDIQRSEHGVWSRS